MGLAGRAFGLTLDRVTSFDVVTADGRRRRVDDGDDLFWALRGGGGSFAIVTAIRLNTRRVTNAAFFRITYPRGGRDEALAAWDALAPHAPRALTAILTLDAQGAAAFGQYLGSEQTLRQADRPARRQPQHRQRRLPHGPAALGGSEPAARRVRRLLALRRASGSAHTGRTAFLAAADTGATLILDAYGGAINRPHRADTAFPHRDARFSVQVLIATRRSRSRKLARQAARGPDRALRQRRLRQLRRPGPRQRAARPTTARTCRGCAGSRTRSTRRTASAPLRASGDGDRRPDLDELVELDDVGVLHAHAAVRDLARDQVRQAGAVDADDAAAGPVGERVRRRARDERDRPVERVAEVRQLGADVELPLRRGPLRLADADASR